MKQFQYVKLTTPYRSIFLNEIALFRFPRKVFLKKKLTFIVPTLKKMDKRSLAPEKYFNTTTVKIK